MFRYNRFNDLDKLQQEMNQVFRYYMGQPRRMSANPAYPAANIYANKEGLVITAELPGFSAEDIEISTVGDVLTLSGERQEAPVPENARYHRQECACGKFSRTLKLPYSIDAEKVQAHFDKGLLKITLPRVEAEKPRKISVHVN